MYIHAHPPQVLTASLPVENPIVQQTDSRPLNLRPYQIIRATVSEGGREKVLLNLKQRQLPVKTRVPLKSGQKLTLQVVGVRPSIELRIVEEAELGRLFRSLYTLGRGVNLPLLLEKLLSRTDPGDRKFSRDMQNRLSVLHDFFQSDPAKYTGKDLARLWDLLGLNLEAVLAGKNGKEAAVNLKSALLMRMKDRKQNQDKSPDRMEHALDQLELFQLCRCRLAQERAVFLPLPFPFLEQGFLLAEKKDHPEKEDKENAESWKMTLSLKLSNLGNLRIMLWFEGLDLRLRVLCDSGKKKEIIEKSLCGLQGHLSAVRLKSYSVATGAREPNSYLVERLIPGGNHFLEEKV